MNSMVYPAAFLERRVNGGQGKLGRLQSRLRWRARALDFPGSNSSITHTAAVFDKCRAAIGSAFHRPRPM